MLLRRFAWADAEIKARQLREVPRPHGGGQSGRHRRAAGRPVGFGTIGRAVAQAFRPHGREGLLLRSGDRRDAQGHRRTGDVAGRTAGDLRRGVAACAAAAGDAEPDRRARACAHEARRGADPGLARRHRRRGGAGGEPHVRPSRRRGGRCLFDRAAGGRQSAAQAHRRSRVAAAADAAHRRRVTRRPRRLLFRSAWQNVERVLVRNEPPLNRVY